MAAPKDHQPQLDAIYNYVVAYHRAYQTPPTLREIAHHTGIKAPSHVKKLLDELVSAGRVAYSPRLARSIRVIDREEAGG